MIDARPRTTAWLGPTLALLCGLGSGCRHQPTESWVTPSDPIDPVTALEPDDRTLEIHDQRATLEPVQIWGDDQGIMPAPLRAMSLTPDGTMAAAAAGSRVALWHRRVRSEPRWLSAPGPIVALTFSASADHLAGQTTDGTVVVWESPWSAPPRTLTAEDELDRPESLAFTTDGRRLIAHHRYWDPATGEPFDSGIHGRMIVGLSPDGTTALTTEPGPRNDIDPHGRFGKHDDPLMFGRPTKGWALQDYASGTILRSLPFDGDLIAAAIGTEHVVGLRRTPSLVEVLDADGVWFRLPVDYDHGLYLSRDGRRCRVYGFDYSAYLDVSEQRQRWHTWYGPRTFDETGRWMLQRTSETFQIYDADDGSIVFADPALDDPVLSDFAYPAAAAGEARVVAYSATPYEPVVLSIFDRPPTRGHRHGGPVTAVAIDTKEQRVASLGWDGRAFIWGPGPTVLPMVGLQYQWRYDDRYVGRLEWSPDGLDVVGEASSRHDHWEAVVWDPITGEERQDFGSMYDTGALIPGGSVIHDDLVHLRRMWMWDQTERERVELRRRGWSTDDPRSVRGGVFTADGRAYFTANPLGRRGHSAHPVRLRRTTTGRVLSGLDLETQVTALQASDDGALAVIGDAAGNLYVWAPATDRSPAAWRGHRGRVRALSIQTAPVPLMVSAGDDGRVRVWSIEGELLTELDLSERTDAPTAVDLHGWSIAVGTARGLVLHARINAVGER